VLHGQIFMITYVSLKENNNVLTEKQHKQLTNIFYLIYTNVKSIKISEEIVDSIQDLVVDFMLENAQSDIKALDTIYNSTLGNLN